MKKILHATLLTLAMLSTGRADNLTRDAQTELKSQGFYYGEINGTLSSETTASIKRFQIRNGLEVTGTLTRETLDSLGFAKEESAPTPPVARVAPAPAPPPSVPQREPRVQIEEDRRFLDREETPPARPPAPRPPVREIDEEEDYHDLFYRTPFASAPPELQRSTVRKAQSFLLKEGIYRDEIDGLPTPEFEEALLTFQRRVRLPLTGRLDLNTLNFMRLLPGRGGPPMQPFHEERRRSDQKVYRGVWVR